MDDKFSEFWDAAKEIDDLSLEGYFGEDAKDLTVRRDLMDISDFFSECLEDWITDTNQYGKSEVKRLIIVFLKLYTESIQQGGQAAIDVITAFMKGFPENPETECLSSYTEFLRLNIETKSIFRELQSNNVVTIADRKTLGSALINTYSKGIELIGKILTTCILLGQISRKEDIKPMEVFTLFLWSKIKMFKQISEGKYDAIIDSIDRDIRNADAHLNIRFVPDKNSFRFKIKKGKKIKSKEVTIEKFIFEKFPVVGWITQAFVFSSMLLILAGLSPNKFRENAKKIFI